MQPVAAPAMLPATGLPFHQDLTAGDDRQPHSQLDDSFLVLDGNARGVQLQTHAELAGSLGWYSPRVPAGETSSKLELALLDHVSGGIDDAERRRSGTRPVGQHDTRACSPPAPVNNNESRTALLWRGRWY